MKASILIPAYNAQFFINKTLESCVLQGTKSVLEIILIDDHSEDNTLQVAQQFARANPEFHFIIETNPEKGACAARNFALSLASGQAIQWLDADDILGPDKLYQQIELLKSNSDKLIASKWQRFEGDLERLYPEERGNWDEVPIVSTPLEWLTSERMTIPASWLGTAEMFRKTGKWDESLLINQDGEFFSRAVATSEGVIFEPNSRVYYRSGIAGSVSEFNPEKAPSLFKTCESFEKVALSIGSKTEVGPCIANKYRDFINRTYPLVPKLRERAQKQIETFGGSTQGDGTSNKPLIAVIYTLFGWKVLRVLRNLKSKLSST